MLAQIKSGDVEKLAQTGHEIRTLVRNVGLPQAVARSKRHAKLSQIAKVDELDVAVRSSATAEDLPMLLLRVSTRRF